jgi:hypothetical protein
VLAGLFRSGHTVAGWTDDDLKKMQKHLEEFWKGIAAEGKL